MRIVREIEDEKKFRALGHAIHHFDATFNRQFLKEGVKAGLDEVTLMNGWILAYLYHHQENDVYQKTIESAFGCSRSTVTGIVKLMEKKGYICRESVPGDARLKKLVLTEVGLETHYKVSDILKHLEERLSNNISNDELDTFYSIIEKLHKNLEEENLNKKLKIEI